MTTSPTPELDKLIQAEPDLVDRIFDYILSEPALAERLDAHIEGRVAELKRAVRGEFRGDGIAKRSAKERQEQVVQILTLFNGRNAAEVARRLQISRATVYRVIKQPAAKKLSHVSGK